ncbi:MAG: ABC transporter ATP-binding protein [Salibacteraceae bacterium]
MFQVSQLQYSYPKGPSFQFPDLELKEAEHLLILGASGVGKTTLLHLIGGLRIPSQGQISIQGTCINTLPQGKLDKFRGRNLGIVFQRPHFVKALTALENLLLVQKLSGLATEKKQAIQVLNNLGIEALAHKKPYRLSQGEQQRLSIAMAVINRPKLLLADEPTSSLDDHNSEQVIDLLMKEAEQNSANLIIITHDQRVKSRFTNTITL